MRSILPGIQPDRLIKGWHPEIDFVALVLSLLLGLTLAFMILMLGPITLPIVVMLLAIPWFIKKPFRIYIWLIISWPILTLFLRIPLPAGIPDLSYDRVMFLLLLCLIFLEALVLKRRLTKISLFDILVIVYVAAQFSSRVFVLWFGGMGTPNLNGLLDIILIPVMMYWITKNLIVTGMELRWFLRALVITCLIICLTGLFEQAMGVRFFKSSVSLGGTEEVYEWQDVPGGRAAGAMGNPAIYGATLGIGILASMAYLPETKVRLVKVALLAGIGLLLVGVLASYTRSAWLSVFVVLFAAQFFINSLWRKTLPLFTLVIILLIVFWDKIPGDSYIVSRALTTDSITPRIGVINLGWSLFLEKPLLGWGSGALNEFGSKLIGAISHNIYLSYLVDGGLVLFLSFFITMVYILMSTVRIYRRAIKNSLERNSLIPVTGGVLIYLISGFFLELRFFGYFNALFWICIGVIEAIKIKLDERVSS
jgi:hypothetical protein